MDPYIFGLLTVQLMVVSWIDLKTKKIFNYWSMGNIVLAMALYLFWPSAYAFSWKILIFPLGFIVVGFVLYLTGIMGAGDSKYLASLFAVVPFELHSAFFERLLYCSITVGAILLTLKMAKDFRKLRAYWWSLYWQGLRDIIKSKFSFAPVIFLAWMLLGATLWS